MLARFQSGAVGDAEKAEEFRMPISAESLGDVGAHGLGGITDLFDAASMIAELRLTANGVNTIRELTCHLPCVEISIVANGHRTEHCTTRAALSHYRTFALCPSHSRTVPFALSHFSHFLFRTVHCGTFAPSHFRTVSGSAYSNLSASIGSSAAAFVAGQNPNTIPTAAANPTDITTAFGGTSAGQFWYHFTNSAAP